MKPRLFICPAKYRPEIEAALSFAIRGIDFDMKLRETGDGAPPGYIDTDETLSGELVILVGETTSKPELVEEDAA